MSRGKCLTRVANLFDSVCEYTKEYPQFACLQNVDMKIQIFYMADIFESLSKLNVSLQGTQITLVGCKRKVSALVDTAMLWKEELVDGNWQSFAML